MKDTFTKLYDDISGRKSNPRDFDQYFGGNGRIDRAVDLILNEDFPKSGSLLDVGGATGNLGFALRNHFVQRYTLDIAEICRLPAESKGNVFIRSNVDAEGLNLPEGSERLDLITALDFIEHIVDPQKFARECFRNLKSGGCVLVNTPNIQFWKHLHSLVIDGRFPHTSGDSEVYHGGHLAFFNLHDMQAIFAEAGFINGKMHTRGLTPEPPPPLWTSVSKVKSIELSYADLIFSCKKP